MSRYTVRGNDRSAQSGVCLSSWEHNYSLTSCGLVLRIQIENFVGIYCKTGSRQKSIKRITVEKGKIQALCVEGIRVPARCTLYNLEDDIVPKLN